MPLSVRLRFLQLLVAFAWSDGSLALDEQHALEQLISDSHALTDSEKEQAILLILQEQSSYDFSAEIDGIIVEICKYPLITQSRVLRACTLLCQMGGRSIPSGTQQHLRYLQQKLTRA